MPVNFIAILKSLGLRTRDATEAQVPDYAADPDGHPWEFTYVAAFPLCENGDLWLPENM